MSSPTAAGRTACSPTKLSDFSEAAGVALADLRTASPNGATRISTTVIARAFLREHIGHRAAMGIAAVVLGGVILAATAQAGIAVGALLVAATCVYWGIDNATTASLDNFTPSQITLAEGFVAASVNVVFGLVLDGLPAVGFVVAGLGIGALGYGPSITMWITGARLVGAARGQAVFALAPFVGALLAWPVNGDRLTVTTMVAFTVSMVGVLVVATSRHQHDHVHEPVEHGHPIDPNDVHHRPEVIAMLLGKRHRHRGVNHNHEHLPDIHHRHTHRQS